jgi:hypothetical protein
LLAKLISRSDICALELAPLVDRFEVSLMESVSATKQTSSSLFKLIGILQTLAAILSSGAREMIEKVATRILTMTIRLFQDHPLLDQNSLLRKMCVKVIQRCGMILLKPRTKKSFGIALRSLQDTIVRKAKVTLTFDNDLKMNDDLANEEDDDVSFLSLGHSPSPPLKCDVDESVESVIESLLSAIQDKDTIVRWSAAKGIGRICSRLSNSLSNQVIDSMLGLVDFSFDDAETEDELKFVTFDENGPSPNSWHGICLALAEITRRGLLNLDQIFKLIPLLVKVFSAAVPC